MDEYETHFTFLVNFNTNFFNSMKHVNDNTINLHRPSDVVFEVIFGVVDGYDG